MGRIAAIGFPSNLARILVERHDVLQVVAVTVDQQEIAGERGRAGRAVTMVIAQFLRLPEHFARTRQRRRALRAEVHIDPAAIENRSRRGIAVLGLDLRRLLETEQLDIVKDLATFGIDRQHAQRPAFLGRRRQPELAPSDDRRGPPQPGKRRLPDHIAVLAPAQRQPRLVRVALAAGTAKFGPFAASKRNRHQQKGGR